MNLGGSRLLRCGFGSASTRRGIPEDVATGPKVVSDVDYMITGGCDTNAGKWDKGQYVSQVGVASNLR